jgi:hypothetical protein
MKRSTIVALAGLAIFYVVAFGSLTQAAKTDPIGHEPAMGVDADVIGHEPAYGAVHGIVIPPFRD